MIKITSGEVPSPPRSPCFALNDIDHRSLTDSLKSASHIRMYIYICSIDSIYSLIFASDYSILHYNNCRYNQMLKRAIKSIFQLYTEYFQNGNIFSLYFPWMLKEIFSFIPTRMSTKKSTLDQLSFDPS